MLTWKKLYTIVIIWPTQTGEQTGTNLNGEQYTIWKCRFLIFVQRACDYAFYQSLQLCTIEIVLLFCK
jgi:hypothetical protein